jgi:hypothetical protein
MARRGPERPVLAPALLTGTSAEFLGRKPVPTVLRERRTVFVLGPEGVGKTTVARALCGPGRTELDPRQLDAVLIDRVRTGAWDRWTEVEALLVDGPTWLRDRPGAVALLTELCAVRAERGLVTVVCQVEPDGSVEALMGQCAPGAAVVLGLRFPKGAKSRLKTALQVCEQLGLPPAAAVGTDTLEPWRYDHLMAHLIERAALPGGGTDGSSG